MKRLFILFSFASILISCNQKQEERMLRALLLTGNDHPAHKWEETTPVIKEILESDSAIEVMVSRNPNRLAALDIENFDFLVLNYCNWEDPEGLSQAAKDGLLDFLDQGGGLMVLHFANGAFHFSLQGAKESDWPEYRKIVHQVWDHTANSTHDKYGEFVVNISDENHFITRGLNDFSTMDELYYNQVGEEDLPALYTAISKNTGKAEPLGWAYEYKNARVFQNLLGHGVDSYKPEAHREILKRAALWVSKRDK
jgi:type 1 glutamine amidotransferase